MSGPSVYNKMRNNNVTPMITTNLDSEQQLLVNSNRSNLYTKDTKKAHNRRINTFITFLEDTIKSNPNFISGSVDELIVNIDYNNVEDKSWNICNQSKKVQNIEKKDG